MVDDDDQPLTEPALEISFGQCEADADGLKLFGNAFFSDVREQYPGYMNLLQLDGDDKAGMEFYDCGMLNFLITKQDFDKGLLKRPVAVLTSL